MHHPFDNFKKLIDQLQMSDVYSVMGQKAYDAMVAEGPLVSGVDHSIRQPITRCEVSDIHLRMSLVFGVGILESMVKDYYQYYSETIDDRQPTISMQHQVESVFIPSSSRCNSGLSTESWQYRLDGWATKRRKNMPKDSVDEQPWQQAVTCVSQYCVSFKEWPTLLESIVIRNLEMHNGGLMNKVTHKHNPICSVGNKPTWGRDLVYGLHTTLDLLNTGLRETIDS